MKHNLSASRLLGDLAFYMIVIVEVIEQTISWQRICSDTIALLYALSLGEHSDTKRIVFQIAVGGLAHSHVIFRMIRDIRERVRGQ